MRNKTSADPSTWKRNCPICNTEVLYKNRKSFRGAIGNNRSCWDCRNKRLLGKNNAFYGRKHTEETKEKLRQFNKNSTYHQTVEFSNAIKRGMVGKIPKVCGPSSWKGKFSEEEIAIKETARINKIRESTSGSKNHRYGKPPANGSGNGWSGWYKGWFFRSLLELNYMINIIEQQGLSWESGEQKRFSVKYKDFLGNDKTYHPDFVINGKIVIECKPKRLWKSTIVKIKAKAAVKFFKTIGLVYKLADVNKPNIGIIKKLHKEKVVVFLARYEQKFIERYGDE